MNLSVEVVHDGAVFDLPDGMEEPDPTDEVLRLRRFVDPSSGLLVSSYRRRGVLSGPLRLEALVGAVVHEMGADPVPLSMCERSARLTATAVVDHGPSRSSRSIVVAVDTDEDDLPVLEVTHPAIDDEALVELADAIASSFRATRA